MANATFDDMLRTIEAEYRLTGALTGRSTLRPEILAALAGVDRRGFVPATHQQLAYADTPLPIGSGQTISQPFIVALMTDLLAPGPDDLVLRMLNAMVDSYLDLRRDLSDALEHAQGELLKPHPEPGTWSALMHARGRLHGLQDLCEEQQDAMQEWLDTLRELPLASYGPDPLLAQQRHDQLVARARDVMEHIERVLRHARRLEQSAETAVQIHFAAQGQRTNDTMRALTAITAVFLPLNLFTGFFGMNFEHLPLIHSIEGMWSALLLLIALALGIVVVFWRRRYLTRAGR